MKNKRKNIITMIIICMLLTTVTVSSEQMIVPYGNVYIDDRPMS